MAGVLLVLALMGCTVPIENAVVLSQIKTAPCTCPSPTPRGFY
jgi:hypothetical protein